MSITSFKREIWNYYRKHKRALPWRNTKDPYRILVSEVMLQQTQVLRVIPKYTAFLEKFPTVRSLSEASLKEVLFLWQGLGYNRRGKMLFESAKEIVKNHRGIIPRDERVLRTLPGVGPYTASAVLAFAYNTPSVCIETNIRSVFIHFFFNDKQNISDREIIPYIEKTLDTRNPREWYCALMDYGAMLKQITKNPSRKSKHHVTQTRFQGSRREVRGAIIRSLVKRHYSIEDLKKVLRIYGEERIIQQLHKLSEEELVKLTKKTARIM